MHNAHEVVPWIAMGFAFKVEVTGEIFFGLYSRTLVYQIAFNHKEESIKEVVNIVVGLMDGHEDGFALFIGKHFEMSDNDEGSKRVQTRSCLIQHHNRRITDQLKSNRCPFLLAPRNTLNQLSTHQCIDTFL